MTNPNLKGKSESDRNISAHIMITKRDVYIPCRNIYPIWELCLLGRGTGSWCSRGDEFRSTGRSAISSHHEVLRNAYLDDKRSKLDEFIRPCIVVDLPYRVQRVEDASCITRASPLFARNLASTMTNASLDARPCRVNGGRGRSPKVGFEGCVGR